MNNRHILILGLTLAVLVLSACLPTQIPLRPPAMPPLTIPTISVPAVPPITLPTVGIPPIVVPTVNAPAIGLTLVTGALNTPAAPASSPAPGVPVTGGTSPDVAKWFLYGLATVIGLAIVIMIFARLIRRTDYRHEIDRPTDRRDD